MLLSVCAPWLFYGIGTMFSLAVLTVMVKLTTKVVGAVALAFVTKYLTSGALGNSEGINSMALQQGGLGLVMTTLIITAPPMAASFFQGVLGQFSSYNSFAGYSPMSQRPEATGAPGGAPNQAESNNQSLGARTAPSPGANVQGVLTHSPGQQAVRHEDAIKQGKGWA